MDSTAARIRVSVFLAMQGYLESFGKKIEPILDDVGLSQALLNDPLGMVSLEPAVALFERAGEVLQDPCFGIHLAGFVPPGGTGVLGKLMVTAPTVRDALSVLANFGHVHTTKISVRFYESDGVGNLEWSLPEEITAPRMQYTTFLSALIVRRLQEAIGGNWRPLKCEFAHRAFDSCGDPEALFGDRLEFDKQVNLLAIDGTSLGCPMPYADNDTFVAYSDLVRRWAEDVEIQQIPDIVITVREYVLQTLSGGQVDLNSVAQSAGLTGRVLQRRLEQSGTSFEDVLQDVRSGLAEQKLKDTDKSITEIAFDLGYSDPSVFTRAARRWFDMSPKDFRQQHRSGSGRG